MSHLVVRFPGDMVSLGVLPDDLYCTALRHPPLLQHRCDQQLSLGKGRRGAFLNLSRSRATPAMIGPFAPSASFTHRQGTWGSLAISATMAVPLDTTCGFVGRLPLPR